MALYEGQRGQVLTEGERAKCQEHAKTFISKILVSSTLHPLAFAKTLFQLGHEPYPLTRGKAWVFFGQDVNYLPNAFKYLRNIYHSHGLATIYTGIGANVLVMLTNDISSFATSMYLDKFYPEIGGAMEEENQMGDADIELDSTQELRVKVRHAIRDSISTTIGIIAARPFTVIMVRQIAQHIGNESKYARYNPFQPLLRIGAEEGPAGYFSGLLPQVVGGLVFVWGCAGVSYAVDQTLKYLEKNQEQQDEESKEMMKNMRTVMGWAIPFAVNSLRYPLEVVATIMAVTGSGLAVSMLPYSPMFSHWEDAYQYLKPKELKRGAQLFMRKEHGPIRVGEDKRLYASKKHFI